jgi:CBS domain-containing protein
MKARDVMTRDVVTVGLGAQVTDIASLLVRRRIGAVPVVTRENHVVGIVSVSDLFRRQELGTEPRRSWLLELFADRDALAREFTRLHGQTAADIMSRPVIAVTEDAELVEVARVLDTHKIKRVPVLRNRVLAGIISRNDIVRGLIRQEPSATRPTTPDDNAIRATLLTQMQRQPWIDATYVSVVVANGIVELSGMVGSEDQRGALRVLAQAIPGVRKVSDHLYIRPVTLADA